MSAIECIEYSTNPKSLNKTNSCRNDFSLTYPVNRICHNNQVYDSNLQTQQSEFLVREINFIYTGAISDNLLLHVVIEPKFQFLYIHVLNFLYVVSTF